MRFLLTAGLLFTFLPGCNLKVPWLGNSEPDPKDPKAIIRKAVEAHGGEENLAKAKAIIIRTRGTVYVNGKPCPETSETVYQNPGYFKSVVVADLPGRRVVAAEGYCDGKGWMKNDNDPAYPVGSFFLEAMREADHAAHIEMYVPLLHDDAYTLETLPETTVNGRPAVGVKVSKKGFRDVMLYFDKETYLQVKSVRASLNFQTLKIVNAEHVFSGRFEYDGIVGPAKSATYRDGKKRAEWDLVECKRVDPLDPGAFAMPK